MLCARELLHNNEGQLLIILCAIQYQLSVWASGIVEDEVSYESDAGGNGSLACWLEIKLLILQL